MKPQDIIVLVALHAQDPKGPETVAALAARCGLSASETHASLKRLDKSRLINGTTRQAWKAATMEFFIHGLRYAFPARPGKIVRGVGTAHAALPLKDRFATGFTSWVWPYEEGEQEGEAIEPLYSSVPRICSKDPVLWEWLSILDSLRAGGARDQLLAREELVKKLGVDAL